jgi:hypothetical protein
MTWMLIMIVVAVGSSREHANVTVVPGYTSQEAWVLAPASTEACEKAGKQAREGTAQYEVTAFCVSGP